jgi:hypothetical protein
MRVRYGRNLRTCDTGAELLDVLEDGTWSMVLPSGTEMLQTADGMTVDYPCWGMVVSFSNDVTIDGVEYPAGTAWMIDPATPAEVLPVPEPEERRGSGFEVTFAVYTDRDVSLTWEQPQGIIWMAVTTQWGWETASSTTLAASLVEAGVGDVPDPVAIRDRAWCSRRSGAAAVSTSRLGSRIG